MENNTTKQNIPQGWKKTVLSKLLEEVFARNKNGSKYSVLSVTNSRGFVLQSEQFARNLHSKDTSNYKIVSKGEFAYNPARINVGSIAVLDNFEKGLLSPMYVVFKTKDDLSTEYFKHYLKIKKFNTQIKNNTAGSVRQSLNFSAFEYFDFIYPKSKKEQQKIAGILGTVDENILKTQETIEATEKIKRGLMRQLFTRGIGHTKFKKTKIGGIPEKWEIVCFKDVAAIKNGQVSPKEEKYRDMILVAPNHIESGSGRIIKKESADLQSAISGKYLVDKGDVIYSKIRPYLKKVALADQQYLCSADMYPIKTLKNLHNVFLFYILLSNHFTDFANSNSARTGIPKINREELGNYKFALPPMGEQQKIAEILSTVDEKISINKKLKANLILLKKGLMQDLLSGKVRVI